MATVKLQQVENVRDLGGIPVGEDRMVKTGLIFRGGAFDKATPEDRETLFSELGIKRVIDLRCGWEREAKPDPEIANVEDLHIPFYDLDIVGIEYTEVAAGTFVVGRDLACEPDHYYRSLANPLTVRQMRQALASTLESAMVGRPVYLHCSGGKDRAGIMALLTLSALGASREAILEDYLLTNISRDKNYQKNFERFLKLSGNEQRAHELVESHRARPENLQAFYEAIEAKYGDMESFMHAQLALDSKTQERARKLCTRAAR